MTAPIDPRTIPGRRRLLRSAVKASPDQSQWTVGRVKRLYRKALAPAHILRSSIRRDLEALCEAGCLVRHDGPARRYYTCGCCTEGDA